MIKTTPAFDRLVTFTRATRFEARVAAILEDEKPEMRGATK